MLARQINYLMTFQLWWESTILLSGVFGLLVLT